MNRFEFRRKLETALNLIESGQYREACEVTDRLDLEQLEDPNALQKISKAYEKCRRYGEAEDVLLQAKDFAPKSRAILYRLCIVAVKAGNPADAEVYYDNYVKLSPTDTKRFILRYRIAEARQSSYEERIRILREFRAEDPDDKWMYELARLYAVSGQRDEAIALCDEIELWYDSGKYVEYTKILHAQLDSSYVPSEPEVMVVTNPDRLSSPYSRPDNEADVPEKADRTVSTENTENDTVYAPPVQATKKMEAVREEKRPADEPADTESAETVPGEEKEEYYTSSYEQPTAKKFSLFHGWRNKPEKKEETVPSGEKDGEPQDEASFGMSVTKFAEEITEGETSEAEETEALPEETIALPEEIEALPEENAPLPEEIEALPEENAPEPEEAIAMPEETEALPEENAPEPEEAIALSEETEALPEENAPEPEEAIALSEETEVLSEETEAEPEESEPEPENTSVEPLRFIQPLIVYQDEDEQAAQETEEQDDEYVYAMEAGVFGDTPTGYPENEAEDDALPVSEYDDTEYGKNTEDGEDADAPEVSGAPEIGSPVIEVPAIKAEEPVKPEEESENVIPEMPDLTFEFSDDADSFEVELKRRQKDSKRFGNLPVEPEMSDKIWHFMVFGSTDRETLEYAREIMKNVKDNGGSCPSQMLKISASKIGEASIIKSLDMFLGRMVIIEQAGMLSDKQLREFTKVLEKDDRSLLIAFTDTRNGVIRMFERVPELSQSFTAVFEGKQLNARDLVNTALEYLYAQGAKATREAEGMIYEYARRLLSEDNGFYKNDIRRYAEEALSYADKGGLFGLSGKKTDKDGYLIVTEKHFRKAETK